MALFLAQATVPVADSRSFIRGTVGAEVNVAVGLARLGHDVAWFGRVGSDDLGRAAIADIRGQGVDVDAVVVDSLRPTGVLVRDQIPGRATSVSYHREGSAGAAFNVDDIPCELIAESDVLHLSGITPMLSKSAHEASLAAVDVAHDHDVMVTLDPNIRLKIAPRSSWTEGLAPFLDCDILFVGEDEAEAVTGGATGDPIEAMHELGARTVVMKRGTRGAVVSDGELVVAVDGFPTVEADAVGAGDLFAAGYLSAASRGLDPAAACREACAVGALSVQGRGDWWAAPTAEARDRFLDRCFETDR